MANLLAVVVASSLAWDWLFSWPWPNSTWNVTAAWPLSWKVRASAGSAAFAGAVGIFLGVVGADTANFWWAAVAIVFATVGFVAAHYIA